jgi:hypothetical protein
MTDFKLMKVVVGKDHGLPVCIGPRFHFSIDNIEKNTITVVRITGEQYIEMEEWLTSHGATIIGYYNALEFCPVYNVTDEIKLLFILKWS